MCTMIRIIIIMIVKMILKMEIEIYPKILKEWITKVLFNKN